jgi:hypothetical protein
MTSITVTVAGNLYFDVTWFFDEFFHVHPIVSEGMLWLLFLQNPTLQSSWVSSQQTRIPFPPPPAVAFIMIGIH